LSKVILEGYIVVPEPDLENIKSELPSHIKFTREEAGCLKFNVNQDQSDSCRFNVYEEFSSKEAFSLHQSRVQSSYWGEITKNVERYYQISEQG